MFSKELINKFRALPTPFYFYDVPLLKKTLNYICAEAGRYRYKIHYALKANSNKRILEIISSAGLGADCVSGNEILRAVETGFDPREIVFAGVGKTDREIQMGIENNIACFNCESVQELEVIDQLAAGFNKKVNVALRLNPNINPNTHHYITTGLEENKFGINIWQLDNVSEKLSLLKNISLTGLHFHIGSQINDLNVFKDLALRVNDILKTFRSRGISFKHINLGGGLGVNYEYPDEYPIVDFKEFFRLFNDSVDITPTQRIHFEPGRSVVAQCGSLISKVLYIKPGVNTNFAIIDAGMTELIRPALYQAYHKIETLTSTGEIRKYDVVGPVCETSDTFAKSVYLPELKRGDLIAIRSTGAYGESMASGYNLRDPVKSYFSDLI